MKQAGHKPGRTFGEADLMLIAGLDRVTAERLILLGLTGYAEMAAWSAADVARWRDRLGLENRISTGNWIEQASLLARGVKTAYAARVRRGEVAALVMRPTDEPSRRRPAATLVAASPTAAAAVPATAPARGSLMNRLGRAASIKLAQPLRRGAFAGPIEEATVEIIRRDPTSSSEQK